ncbi:MAG: leucyl aminopeptidase family protein [Phenylobacterium sp.]
MTDTYFEPLIDAWDGDATPIEVVDAEDVAARTAADARLAALAKTADFSGKSGQVLLIPGVDGALERVLFAPGGKALAWRGLPARLPGGVYRLESPDEAAATAFALGSYRFERYKSKAGERPRLLAQGIDAASARRTARACALARDMVNTPANDLGPAEIEALALDVAARYGAAIAVIIGDDLLTRNYPAVHAVGRAAHPARAPRMIEISWGRADGPLVALVGKGVVFDTGGLDIKPSAGMRLMKKDMGGAAHALALGQMVMDAGLPVRLSVLLPVVENAISGDAMRPGDVLASRAGLSIEVGNTDAEGRLILADALTRAGELEPALTIDMATLTGAARVALGPQLPPLFTDDEDLAREILAACEAESDPVWRLPMWSGYEDALDTDIADLKNDPDAWAQAGAVTAALFLRRFAPKGPWAHLDIYAWNPRGRPGWPVGGEAQAIRGLFRMIRTRFA